MQKKDREELFPIFRHYPTLSYLDNAATTQKPRTVIQAISSFYEKQNANIHRAVYHLAEKATQAYEQTRALVAQFINAKDEKEIIFTRGTTEAINFLARALEPQLEEGDNILLSLLEHHSNLVPWQMLAQRKKVTLSFWNPLENPGIEGLKLALQPKTRIVSLTHVSNTLGSLIPVEKIAPILKAKKILFIIDGAQAIAHLPVDVQAIGADFYVFSGHKMYGPTGIGCLWGRKEHLQTLEPVFGGGDMILTVELYHSTYNEIPYRFEAGTPPIASVIGLGEAIRFLNQFNKQEIREKEKKLSLYLKEQLSSLSQLLLYESPLPTLGIFSFNLKNIHPHDVGTILDTHQVAIRTGHHCTQPLMKALGTAATCRASLALYNNEEDIDQLIKALKKSREIFKPK